MNYTPEELEKMIEKAKKELEESLAKMTPEERAEAERKAQKMIEEDRAEKQRIIDSANKVLSDLKKKKEPVLCPFCCAPVNGEKFCAYCGSPLQNN